ncbi:MAG: lipoprotein-releasing system permease protein [Saprospiraceae bacterium]|jgi:lipoprotein-releasing system permease protein
MNVSKFIADRILTGRGKNFSSLIVKIAIGAIALSMMVMIITTNVITGFKNEISEKVFDFWGHIQITDGNSGDAFEAIPFLRDEALLDSLRNIRSISYARPARVSQPDVINPELKSKGGIEYAAPYIVVNGILNDNKIFEGVLLRGIEPTYSDQRMTPFLVEGRALKTDGNGASRDIMISRVTADRMEKKIGDKIIVNFILNQDAIKKAFTVVGIYKTGLVEYDQRFAIVDMAILQEVLGWQENQISGIELSVEHLEDMDILSDFIYFELLPGNLYSESIRSKFYQIFEWLELQDINEYVIIILMILVALINMITGLLIFVLERAKMVGVLKALGAQNWTIRKIFLYHAGRILILGILIGNALGLLICGVQKYTGVMKLSEEYYYLSQVPIQFDLVSMMWINIGTLVTVLICLIIPSNVVANISPIKTIRFN